MAEAYSCTPVIGSPCGSVPEIVKNGFNGFICSDVEEGRHGQSFHARSRAVRADCEVQVCQRWSTSPAIISWP
jgi:glycosyltransferase involved in cell wall biosynthesis